MPSLDRAFGIALLVGAVAGAGACAPSVQQEVDMGNDYAAQIDKQLPLIKDAAIVSLFNQSVTPLKRVAQRQDLTWTFHIVNSDQVNAFAVPGGHVYIFRGLIARAKHYDEFAGAVAHEIGHVDLRHSAQQMGQMNAANIGVNLAYILLGRQPGQVDQAAVGVAGSAVFAKFSRDDEREADSMAVISLTKARIRPSGLTHMMQTLQNLDQSEPGKVQQWFASHPMAGERVANTQRIIAATPGAAAMSRTGQSDYNAFDQLRARLAALPPAPKEVKAQ